MRPLQRWSYVGCAVLIAALIAGCGNERQSRPAADRSGPGSTASEGAAEDEGEATGEEAAGAEPTEEAEGEEPAEEGAEPDEGGVAASEAATPSIPEPELHEADRLRLTELVLARGVEERQPVNKTQTFELGRQNRVYVWLRLENPDQRQSEVTIEWVPPDGRARPGAKLSVPASPRYVTWAFRGLPVAGRWAVQAKTPEGSILGRAEFDVTTDAPEEPAEAEPASAEGEPAGDEGEPAAATAAGTATAASGLKVLALTVCRDVVEREPVDPTTRFSIGDGGRIFAHLRLENPSSRPTKINLTWQRPDGMILHGVHLNVPASPRYVTWAFRGMPPRPGTWVALARGPEGTVLARQEIEVVE